MKRGPKHGNILGIRLDSTRNERLLEEISLRLENKERFYLVTPNPEIVLKATSDWLLKKTILRSTFSVPDGIGLKFAYKFLHNEKINVIKGRELFYDVIRLANQKALRVFFVGGEYGEAEKSIEILSKTYQSIIFKTHKTPSYGPNGQPISDEDKKMHKELTASIKMFEPELIFVGMTPPKQEKWILRNFFRLNAVGAMAVGGTFNYVSGNLPLPPTWLASLGLEWLWRVICEPSRIVRIWNAVIVFTFRILIAKLFKQRFKS